MAEQKPQGVRSYAQVLAHCSRGTLIDEIWVYDENWQPLPDVAERCAAEQDVLEEMARECTRFLKGPTGE